MRYAHQFVLIWNGTKINDIINTFNNDFLKNFYTTRNGFKFFSKYTSKRFIFRKIYIQHYASLIEFYFILTFASKFQPTKVMYIDFFSHLMFYLEPSFFCLKICVAGLLLEGGLFSPVSIWTTYNRFSKFFSLYKPKNSMLLAWMS